MALSSSRSIPKNRCSPLRSSRFLRTFWLYSLISVLQSAVEAADLRARDLLRYRQSCETLRDNYQRQCHRVDSVAKYEGPTLEATAENLRALAEEVRSSWSSASASANSTIPIGAGGGKSGSASSYPPALKKKNPGEKLVARLDDEAGFKILLEQIVNEISAAKLEKLKIAMTRLRFGEHAVSRARELVSWKSCLDMRFKFVHERCPAELFPDWERSEARADAWVQHEYATQYIRDNFEPAVDSALPVATGILQRQDRTKALLRILGRAQRVMLSGTPGEEDSNSNSSPSPGGEEEEEEGDAGGGVNEEEDVGTHSLVENDLLHLQTELKQLLQQPVPRTVPELSRQLDVLAGLRTKTETLFAEALRSGSRQNQIRFRVAQMRRGPFKSLLNREQVFERMLLSLLSEACEDQIKNRRTAEEAALEQIRNKMQAVSPKKLGRALAEVLEKNPDRFGDALTACNERMNALGGFEKRLAAKDVKKALKALLKDTSKEVNQVVAEVFLFRDKSAVEREMISRSSVWTNKFRQEGYGRDSWGRVNTGRASSVPRRKVIKTVPCGKTIDLMVLPHGTVLQLYSTQQDYRITGKLPRARLTFARPPRCVTGVEVVENVDVNGVGVELNGVGVELNGTSGRTNYFNLD